MPHPSGHEPGRARDDAADATVHRRALLLARIAIVIYLLQLLLNLLRPKVFPGEPALSLFQDSELTEVEGSPFASFDRLLAMPEVVFWTVLAGILVGALVQAYTAIARPRARREARLTWVTIGAMLGPFGLLGLTVVIEYPLQALACVPGTAVVLVLLHAMQRFARIPAPMLLIAFGWGALVVFGLGRAYTNLAFGTLFNHLFEPSAPAFDTSRIVTYVVLHLSAMNVLVAGAGIAVMLMLLRRRGVDAMTGLTLGAAVGLGYCFVEGVLAIKVFGSFGGILETSGGFQYWIRQSAGLLGGMVALGALLGAGLALAAATRDRTTRWARVAAAFATAIGGAVATEMLASWWSRSIGEHIETGGAFDTLVVSPFIWLLPQSPFIVLAVLMLRSARRARAADARAAVTAETTEGGGAITRTEAPFLIDPSMRFWALAGIWRRHGRDPALRVLRLQSAQLELAASHLHRGEDAARAGEEGSRLRAKVMRLKSDVGSAVTR
ncbi:PrsW family glutamic-type intramembrane protease [Spirillospora sp. NPDC029432]|uniref:PrsW family glutamic-type intramembrane protease n=1 Tax=Spirillospora sp. NPDC029432 TaxID=3154599 RepID=UPI003457010F